MTITIAKRAAALFFSVSVLFSALPLAASAAASPQIEQLDGERTVLISSFGRLTYNGQNYVTYRTLADAIAALGDEGGNVYFTGTVALGDALTSGSSSLTIKGIDKKVSSCVIDATGLETVELQRDVTWESCALKTDKNVAIRTNGHSFMAASGFDAYCEEYFITESNRGKGYPAPLIVTAGDLGGEKAKESVLSSGTYAAVAGGTYGSASAAADTCFIIDGGSYEAVYAGNFAASGSFDGASHIRFSGGTVKKAVLGSDGGTSKANFHFDIQDGAQIDELVVGSETVTEGNLVVILSGGKISRVTAGAKPSGKVILISSVDASKVPEELCDYRIVADRVTVEPQFNGTQLSGFTILDRNGFIPSKVFANGQEITGVNGVYTLPEGTVTVSCETAAPVSIQKELPYIAGYTDGSFAPQKRLTRAEAITLLSRLLCQDISVLPSVARCDYRDVAPGDWYCGVIGFFETLGYLDKLETEMGSCISPNAPITRGEFAELSRHVLSEMYEGRQFGVKFFPDVPESHPYFDAISQLSYLGVIGGYPDGSFRPEGQITRAEVVSIVNRFLGRIPTGEAGQTGFYDIAGHWAESQILAACSPAVSGDVTVWTEGGDVTKGSWELPNGGTGTVGDNIRALREAAQMGNAEKDIISGIDVVTDRQIEAILNAPSEYPTGGTVYYISPDGNNDNDGLTPETAWKTLAKLGKAETAELLKEGDSVLFRRGGEWRGNLITAPGVTYSAYGEGAKPIINGSRRNYADPRYWKETDVANVYSCALSPQNAGVIVFDDKGVGAYDNLVGTMRVAGVDGFTGYRDLKYDLDFYSDINSGTFYLYCENGNPGERFASIEIGSDGTLVKVPAPGNVTIDNISFRFTGSHAVGIGGRENVTVKNCTFDYIGGSVLLGFYGTNTTRYGNALQVFGSCDGWYVRNNWICQIYDTGITHQYNSSYEKQDATMVHVEYTGNVIEYCHWSIEYYNPDYGDTKHSCKDIYIADNICRMNGYGWGSRSRQSGAHLIESIGITANTENFVFENNIFDRASGNLLNLPGGNDKKVIFRNNMYIQKAGGMLGRLYGSRQKAGKDGQTVLNSLLGEEAGILLFHNDETVRTNR